MTICECCGQPIPDVHGLVFDRGRREVRFRGRALQGLTGREFAMLEALYARIGRVCSKEHLMHELYALMPAADEPEIKIVDVFICKLRRKLRGFGLEIRTHWGEGYELVAPPPMEERAA